MQSQDHAQFTIYATEADIPRHQRAWVWGVAALGILLCGIAAGWLFGSPVAQPLRAVNSAALLTRQETVNQQLRDRIARLEQGLSHAPCSQEALDALTQSTHTRDGSP